MTKIRPKLFVETGASGTPTEINAGDSRVNSIYSETDRYSITPKTFVSRTLLAKDLSQLLRQNLQALNDKNILLDRTLNNLNNVFQEAEKLGIPVGTISGAQNEFTKSPPIQKVITDLKAKKLIGADPYPN